MSIRSTYALDTETAQRIKRLARAWGVSQAEVIRRSIGLASQREGATELSPADVVAFYRSAPAPRTRQATEDLIAQLHRDRHDDDARRAATADL